jgi:perosamine synthetase
MMAMKGNSKLAIFGGEPVFREGLPHYNSMGQEELDAVGRVMKSGCLSAFYGSAGEEFFGGPMIKDFEKAWRERFGVRHAVSVNSATSGLYAAMGAVGISPGDEVIVPPYTMSATAMAPLVYGGIPVFADIDPDTFCLDPEAVRRVITPRTKAILAVNLFGHPAPLEELRSIADKHHLRLIEDNAQGPLASEHGCLCGTVGDIGIFSLNYHKHIHTGEGGMCVTDQDELAKRLRLIRNHAENLVEDWGIKDITNLVGFNYRMTELSAAVGIEQLKKIEFHVEQREQLGQRVTSGISGLEGLTPPKVRSGCRHVYYLWAMRFDRNIMGATRGQFSRALAAEGFPHFNGYVRPLYLLPVFQRRTAFGSRGYPFDLSVVSYPKGLCPVCERMHEQELICFETCMYEVTGQSLDLLIEAIHKVHACREELSSLGE